MKLELPEEVRRMRRLSAMMYVRWKSAVMANISGSQTDDVGSARDGAQGAHAGNPETVVYIRADQHGFNKDLYAVIDVCQKNGLTKFSLRTKEDER